MGGKVTVISQVGVGTKFKIIIDVDAFDKIAQQIDHSNPGSQKSEKNFVSEMFENNFGIDMDY